MEIPSPRLRGLSHLCQGRELSFMTVAKPSEPGSIRLAIGTAVGPGHLTACKVGHGPSSSSSLPRERRRTQSDLFGRALFGEAHKVGGSYTGGGVPSGRNIRWALRLARAERHPAGSSTLDSGANAHGDRTNDAVVPVAYTVIAEGLLHPLHLAQCLSRHLVEVVVAVSHHVFRFV